MDNKKSFSLRLVFLRLLGIYLFIPLTLLCLLTVAGVAFWGEQNLKSQQYQIVESVAESVNNHLDNSGRILEAIAKVAEVSDKDELSAYMKSTWEAYGYFDTLYYLDKNNISIISFPFDIRYLGLDMSNIPDFKSVGGNNTIISSPFISLRTGEPTVYLVRILPNGERIVGELSLGLLQKDVTKINNSTYNNSVFIMAKSGIVLAHPSIDMVRQQVNMSNLGIFKLNLSDAQSLTYSYYGKSVVGTAVKIEKTGWVIVDQTEKARFWSSYALILLLVFAGEILVFFALSWNLRKQLHRYVETPFEKLGEIVNELADGNYNKVDFLSAVNASISEFDKFAQDFQAMSTNLQKREAALKESEDRYRGLFNRVPIGLFRTSQEGELLDVNPAVVNILGYPDKASIIGIKIAEKIFSHSDTGMIPGDFEAQLYRYDGSVICVRVKAYLAEDEHDNQLYYEGSIEDITKVKEAEKELKNAKQELELQVEQRTRQLVELNMELQQLTSLDGLTGINNRRCFDQFLEKEWQRSIRQGTPISLIILDLDFFKNYNDYYGHQAGDECLKRVASALKSGLKRSSDLAARYGGEEFVAVLPDTDASGAAELAEELRRIIESLEIKHEKSPLSKFITVSIGVASMIPDQDTMPSQIITIADHALYNAKREGRNCICVGKNI